MHTLLPVLRALHEADVDHVVVGGVAVVLRGHPRMTVDLDLVLDMDRENVERTVHVLTSLGLRPRLPVEALGFADPTQRAEWIARRNLTVFSMHHPDDPRLEVDLFAEEPRPYDDLVTAADTVDLDGVPVVVASVDHLIEMKRAAGRPQDLADIAALEALEEAGRDS